MAELIIQPFDSPAPDGIRDGDVVHAFDEELLLWQHTQRLCCPKKLDRGFKSVDSLTYQMLNATSQYRFETIGQLAVRRITIETQEVEVLTGPEFDVSIAGAPAQHITHKQIRNHRGYGTRPEEIIALRIALRGANYEIRLFPGRIQLRLSGVITPFNVVQTNSETMHVPEFVYRRIKANKRPMFGDNSKAIWFGGATTANLPRLDDLWKDHITPSTRLLAADHRKREYSDQFLRKYLVVVTNDFSSTRRLEIEESDDDESGKRIRLRKRRVRWENLLEMSGHTVDDVRNKTKVIPVRRDLVRNESSIVETKE